LDPGGLGRRGFDSLVLAAARDESRGEATSNLLAELVFEASASEAKGALGVAWAKHAAPHAAKKHATHLTYREWVAAVTEGYAGAVEGIWESLRHAMKAGQKRVVDVFNTMTHGEAGRGAQDHAQVSRADFGHALSRLGVPDPDPAALTALFLRAQVLDEGGGGGSAVTRHGELRLSFGALAHALQAPADSHHPRRGDPGAHGGDSPAKKSARARALEAAAIAREAADAAEHGLLAPARAAEDAARLAAEFAQAAEFRARLALAATPRWAFEFRERVVEAKVAGALASGELAIQVDKDETRALRLGVARLEAERRRAEDEGGKRREETRAGRARDRAARAAEAEAAAEATAKAAAEAAAKAEAARGALDERRERLAVAIEALKDSAPEVEAKARAHLSEARQQLGRWETVYRNRSEGQPTDT